MQRRELRPRLRVLRDQDVRPRLELPDEERRGKALGVSLVFVGLACFGALAWASAVGWW